jgi:FixJ family two-component response regulator
MRQTVVAVVDDDSGMRRALKNLLKTHGFVVELHASAADFIESATLTKASCLVTDIQLKDLSWIEMCRRLRDSGFSMPVVFMTASLSRAIRARAMEFGCAAYLTKPFPAQALLDAIENASREAET